MSVEAPKTVEETASVETKPVEQSTETPALTTSTETPVVDAPKTETTETPATAAATTTTDEAKPAEETLKKDETTVEAVPASEGVLGYKAPGLLKQFHFSKHFFYFSEEPLSSEALTSYVRSEKTGVAQNAAWARETGKGVLFHSKRAEDKAHPAGLIPLAEATNVAKQGALGFSFEVHGKSHKFEATTAAERDSWIVAVEKQVAESKALKEEITGSDSYKENVKEFSKPAVVAAVATSRSKSKEPKKSLDANTATAAATTETKPEETTTAPIAPVATATSPVEEKKKDTAKERSQSRKRTSIFGSLIGKKDEAKEEKKAEDKVEKEEKKEDKKAEAEIKKEEAKEDHSIPKAAEAAAATTGAAAIAAAPAAVVSDNTEEKKEETPAETTTPTEKKAKRGSVFGSLFNKKVTSPTTEKTEKEVGPATPAKDDVPPVSDTAPKLDEPIENKPIDTAAVTAPANTDGATEAPKETPAETKAEKKSFLSGLINKKPETKKEETKPTESAAATETAPTLDATPATESVEAPKAEEAATKEERPTEKRRSSLFGGLGTIKKKDETKTNEDGTERKREKSPLPSKIGGLFRRPSKAVKSEEPKAVETKDETKVDTLTEATPATTEPTAVTTDAKVDTPATDSKIIGDVVPETLQAQDKVATAPEVKATA